MHLKLYIVTPAVYTTPAVTVSSRLLVRVLDDLLLPTAYPAELAGTCYSLGTGQGGLVLKVTGFQGVAQQLMGEVLSALKGGPGGGWGGGGVGAAIEMDWLACMCEAWGQTCWAIPASHHDYVHACAEHWARGPGAKGDRVSGRGTAADGRGAECTER